MIRRISSLALGIVITFGAASAFAQEEEGGGEPAGGGEKAPAGAKPAGGEAKGGEASAAASTENPPDAGGKIKIGLRLGYALPLGASAKTPAGDSIKMSDSISGMIPIWLDLGYMITPNIMLGVYAQYGIVMIKKADSATSPGCPSGADCSGNDIRFGLQAQYHLGPGQSLDPWFGLGVGYEMLNSKKSAGGNDVKSGLKGFEFVNLQGGADFKVMSALYVGPFVSFSLGQFSSQSVDPEPPGFDSSIKDKAMHEWLTLGVKGTFGI